MRIDVYLKHTGLIKRRTVAKNYCLKGLVLINNKTAKPSSEVNDGDDVTLIHGNKMHTFIAHIEQKGNIIYVSYEAKEENEA